MLVPAMQQHYCSLTPCRTFPPLPRQTHTMEGTSTGGAAADGELPAGAGIIPRTFRHIFGAIGASTHQTFLVRASMLEIYNEEIRDLLSKAGAGRG